MEKLIAERIGQLAGISLTSELENILVELLQGAKEGHFCCQIKDASLLPKELYSEGKEAPFLNTPLVLQGDRLYLQRNWALETLLLKKVSELLAREPSESVDRFNVELSKLTGLQEAQHRALSAAVEKMFVVFSGGPGTGKTFTAGCFIRLLAASSNQSLKVAIAAPTGKAASHLEYALKSQGPLESQIKCESTTLHRLLRLQPGRQRLLHQWTIDADLVVVDEASMLDSALLLHLLNAIGPNTRLLLLGDQDQLPPIEGGGIFAELADLFGQKLERSMRMGSGGLFEYSQAVRSGCVQEPDGEEVCWLGTKEPTEWVDWFIEKLPPAISLHEPSQASKTFQILCALRQGPLGSDALNREILARFEKKLEAGQWLAVPIMIVQNNPQLQLYNGTTGVLVRKALARQAVAYFDGGRTIAESELPRYETAFCLSVHKSQGSEYEEVVLLFPPGSEKFGREALYTGITRAKKKANLAMDRATLESLLKTTSKGRSGFTERFKRTPF